MTSSWDQYLVGQQEPEIAPQANVPTQEEESINWNKYRPKEEMGYVGEAARHLTRIGSRVGETLLGLPGDTVQFVNWLNSKMPKVPQFLEKEPSFLRKKSLDFINNIPTSQDLKQKASEISEGFTDPQGAMEEFGDSIFELATALSVGKDPTKIKNLVGSIGKAIGAKSAKKTAEELGAGEKGQVVTELGTLFLMGLANKPMAEKFIQDKYKLARSKIPEGTMLPTENLSKELTSLENDLSKGISTSTKTEVKNAVKELNGKISGGAFPAEELVDSFHDINERLTSKKLFDELNSTEKKKLKFRYDQFKDKVRSELSEYGKYNPEFYKEWQSANEGYASIQQSKKVSKFLESHLGKLPQKIAGSIALEMFLGHPEFAIGTAGTFAGLKTGELLYRVGKSSALREHYLEVIKAASEENLPATLNALNKLDKGLKESFIGGIDRSREKQSQE